MSDLRMMSKCPRCGNWTYYVHWWPLVVCGNCDTIYRAARRLLKGADHD
jgi:uncharacterized C2H2 Zn-finger protein